MSIKHIGNSSMEMATPPPPNYPPGQAQQTRSAAAPPPALGPSSPNYPPGTGPAAPVAATGPPNYSKSGSSPPNYPPGTGPAAPVAATGPPDYSKSGSSPPNYPPGTGPAVPVAATGPPNYSKSGSSPPNYPPGAGPDAPVAASAPPAYPKPPKPDYPKNSGPANGVKAAEPPAYPAGVKPYNSSASASASASANAEKASTNSAKWPSGDKSKELLDKAKAAADEFSSIRTTYAYTQGSFWGGPNADYTVLAILACFPLTGLVGLDHHYMRSPMTAALKTILNVFTLGLWYFYDMGQVLTESDHVKKYGYSMPFFGPTGLGAGLFPQGGQPTQGSSPIRFMLYSIAATIGPAFGVDHLAAGDFIGFMAKIFTLPIWIFFMWWNPLYWVAMFFGIIWSLYTIFRLWFNTEDLFVHGVARFFPFTLIMSDYKCANEAFGPNRPCSQDVLPSQGIWSRLFNFFKGLPVVGNTLATVEKTVEVAKVAGTVAVEVGKKAVAPVIGAAGAAVKVGADVISAGKDATAKATEIAQNFTDPAFLAEVAANKSLPTQKGGGQQPESKSNFGIYALFAATVGASFLTQFLRKSEYVKLIPDILQSTIKVRNDLPPA